MCYTLLTKSNSSNRVCYTQLIKSTSSKRAGLCLHYLSHIVSPFPLSDKIRIVPIQGALENGLGPLVKVSFSMEDHVCMILCCVDERYSSLLQCC